MSNLFKMVKQAAAMRKEMHQIQGELAKNTVEYSANGGKVTVVARADMSIESIKIDPLSLDPASAGRLQEIIVLAVNGALKAAKKKAGSEMTKLAGSMGLGNLLE